MSKKMKFAVGATALAGAGAVAYKKWQEDEQFQQNVQQSARQAAQTASDKLGDVAARGEEEAPLE